MRVGEPCPVCSKPAPKGVNSRQQTCSFDCGQILHTRRADERRDARYRAALEAMGRNVDRPAQVPTVPDSGIENRSGNATESIRNACRSISEPVAERTRPSAWPDEPVAPHAQPAATGQRPADDIEPLCKLHLPRRTVIREAEPEPRAALKEFPAGGIICDGDNHFPIANAREHAAKLAFARDVNPSAWVNIGDLIDCWFLSRYTKEAGRLFGAYGAQLQEEIDSARPYVEAMCSVVKEAHLILGNHEHRQLRLINENPGLHGLRGLGWARMLEYPEKLTVHPYGTRLRAFDAPLDFIHGDRVPLGVKNKAAWVLANLGNRSTVFGHGHHVQKETRTFYDEAGEPIIHGAYQQGHGSIVSEQTYVTEPNWQPGFSFIEFWKDDHGKSRFSVHEMLFIDGRFSWNGRVYDGRKWQ